MPELTHTRTAMNRANWFDFKASAEAPAAELYLYDEIGGWGASASQFISELGQRKSQHINLHIHSPGGSVFEGHAIFNALRNHPGGVTVYIDGIAASMASVIAMAGKPVKIASNGFLMIHNPWSETAGDSIEIRKQADVLDKLKDSLVQIYAQKSGMPEDEISAAMDAETWLNAEEAVSFGLADEIFEGLEVAAKIDLSSIAAKAPSGVLVFSNPWPAPGWMRDNFRKGLDWFEKGFAGDGLAEETVTEARAIAGGAMVSPDKAQRMAAWFARHMGDLDGVSGDEEKPTPGMVAHALWGGWPKADSERAMAWAEAKYAEHEKTQEESNMETNEPAAEAVVEEPVLADEAPAVVIMAGEAAVESVEGEAQTAEPEASIDAVASLLEVQAKLNAHIAELKAALDSAVMLSEARAGEIASLKEQLDAERKAVNAKAAHIVATAGHPPIALGASPEPISTGKPEKNLLSEYKELTEKGSAAERLAFVRKHRNELIAAAKPNK
jgi:ATP-dependent Clp endopeptidase proteolytic subunit ClpP